MKTKLIILLTILGVLSGCSQGELHSTSTVKSTAGVECILSIENNLF